MFEPVADTPSESPVPPSPARAKLEALIESGRINTKEVLARILREQPTDYVVKSTSLNFALTETGKPALTLESGDVPTILPLHAHAAGQVADKLGIPRAFADRLSAGGATLKQLLIHVLNALSWAGEGRYLVRTVTGEVRGFLSDKYRRMNSQPILDAFIGAVSAAGAVPYAAVHTDISFALRAILPTVHTIGDGDEIAFGLELCSSDYGARALSVSLYSLRIRCQNLALCENSMRKIHLGTRLPEDASFSEKTYELDTQTIASAVVDIVNRDLLPERITTLSSLLNRAAHERVSPDELAAWLKKNVSKAEAEAVTTAFTSPDIIMLPPGQTWWRLSNALSWVSQTADAERRLDLERLAGSVLAEAADDSSTEKEPS
jgi:hypothetical protein